MQFTITANSFSNLWNMNEANFLYPQKGFELYLIGFVAHVESTEHYTNLFYHHFYHKNIVKAK